jgi:predicted dehydrogenase
MNMDQSELNRRDFLAGGSFATLMMLLGGVPLRAAEETASPAAGGTNYKGEATPVNVGIIGCGLWAREIIKTLALIPHGPVVAVADPYPAYLRRAGDLAPGAQRYKTHTELLADPKVQAVIIATPTHQHRDLAIEALKAGKHVYCEAPLAHTVEDARAICRAAKDHPKLNFQAGLQSRADIQIANLHKWRIQPAVWGKPLAARQQWNKKQSWRLASPNPEREAEINWRLNKAVSLGLVGEIGVHQLDVANWFFGQNPVAVSGVGSVLHWKDGREVPDTVRVICEYPGGITASFESTIANSFEGELAVFLGSEGAIMVRERKAWLFKEADAPVLGWEVYSKREEFYRESGLTMGAGGTKQETHTADRFAPADPKSPLQYSLDTFLINSHNLEAGVKDFTEIYGEDETQLLEYLKDQEKNRQPAAGWKAGLAATVTAIKANEAIVSGRRLELKPADFEV